MQKIITGTQMREIDRKAIEDLNIPSIILMENAGRAVYEQTIDIIEENEISNLNVLVLCGKGNNGGDGFVAARHLAENDIQTTIVSLFNQEELSSDAFINHEMLKHFSDILYYQDLNSDDFIELVSSSNIIIDAILGTGLTSEIKGIPAEAVEIINQYAEEFVLSVDIPSGVDANTGKIMGNAIFADYTVTFFAPKIGHVLYPGAEHCGSVNIANIGIPEYLISTADTKEYSVNLLSHNYISQLLPTRPNNSHKGTFGSVLNIAGSLCMTGAAYMCSFPSLKVGAGYSTLATPKSIIPSISSMSPELIYLPLSDNSSGIIAKSNISEILENCEKHNSILIGPGMGTEDETVEFIKDFIVELSNRDTPCLFDADALNCLAKIENFVLPLNSIITPHSKELARLMSLSLEEILDNRIYSATKAAELFDCVVVLKGARTIIAEPDGTVYINPTGNTALATAGTGDVLAGMIAGFVAQNLDPLEAAILGAYLHGLAGDLAAEKLSEYSTTAVDIINYIPNAINELL